MTEKPAEKAQRLRKEITDLEEQIVLKMRTCQKCGFTQYTNHNKPVVTDYEPDFEKPIEVRW